MLGLVEYIRLGINLEAGIGKPQAGRNLTDPDNRNVGITHRFKRLLTEFASERQAIFVENVAQTLRHTYGAAQKNRLPASFIRLPHGFSHVFDASVKPLAGLPLHKKGRARCAE